MTATPNIAEDTAFYQALGFSQQRAAEKAERLYADMARLNAELRESGRRQFRRAVAEYVIRPDLFLEASASALRVREIRSIDDACIRHATACKAFRRRIEADPLHWAADSASVRLATHEKFALIARYLRRFGKHAATALAAE